MEVRLLLHANIHRNVPLVRANRMVTRAVVVIAVIHVAAVAIVVAVIHVAPAVAAVLHAVVAVEVIHAARVVVEDNR